MTDPDVPTDLPEHLAEFLSADDDAVLVGLGTAPGEHARVAARFADVADLRAARVPRRVRARQIGIWIDRADTGVTLAPRPGWPNLKALRSRVRGEGVWTTLRFSAPIDVARVVREIGRLAVGGGVGGGLRGDAGLRVRYAGETDEDTDDVQVPPDVVIVGPGTQPPVITVSEVTGVAPLVVTDLDGPVALGPIDERVINPAGFLVRVDGPVVPITDLDLRDGATASVVAGLRDAAGVTVQTWDDAAVRAVAGLAMAGVPVVAADAPAGRLGADVVAAITAPVDLADSMAREEHSLVLRRAALDTFSDRAWRAELGRRAGVPVAGQPSVSVVLASKRPEMLDFAFAQVARQCGVDRLELVLAPHGFDVDPARVQEAVGATVAVQVLPQPPDALFGDVLQAATVAARGALVLKMDDDDWYAPDVVVDLLRARAYSGADLVGMPLEFHYVDPVRTTVQKGHPSEFYARFIAGGTMLIDRSHLLELGGFRQVRKFVDAQLLDAVLNAGGTIYRTHGLGYVLRRTQSGHTWDITLEELLDPDRMVASWPGFHPSRLMEADPRYLPD